MIKTAPRFWVYLTGKNDGAFILEKLWEVLVWEWEQQREGDDILSLRKVRCLSQTSQGSENRKIWIWKLLSLECDNWRQETRLVYHSRKRKIASDKNRTFKIQAWQLFIKDPLCIKHCIGDFQKTKKTSWLKELKI